MATRIQNNKYKHKLNCRPATTCESSFPKDAVENSIPWRMYKGWLRYAGDPVVPVFVILFLAFMFDMKYLYELPFVHSFN